MLRRIPALAIVSILFGPAAPVFANELSLSISGGRVTLVADSVTVRQILAEWARVGQTRIVNGERVSGPPVSLRLVDVPERQALETILRSVSGYLAAPRAQMAANESVYDRILILPTSVAPPAAAVPARPAGRVQPFAPPVAAEAEPVMDESETQEEMEMADPAAPVPGMPQRPGEMVPVPMQPGPSPATPEDGTAPGPQPFPGVAGTAARPGEIVAPPAPQPQTPAGPFPVRPRPVTQPPQPQ